MKTLKGYKRLLELARDGLSSGQVSAQKVYEMLKGKVLKKLADPDVYVPFKIHNLLTKVVPPLYDFMSVDERVAFYKHLGHSEPNVDVLKMIFKDYQNPKLIDRESLTEVLLSLFIVRSVVESLDKNLYMEFLTNAVVFCINNKVTDDYYFRLFSLIGDTLTVDEFRALSQQVANKLSGNYRYLESNKVRFLMYTMDIINDFQMNFLSKDFFESKAGFVRVFVGSVYYLIPYLSGQKFLDFKQYVEPFMEKDLECLSYFLNNDYVRKNRKFMLDVLRTYLNSSIGSPYEVYKLKRHKLLINSDTVSALTQKQTVVLAARSVEDKVSVRFKFTKDAFRLVKTKLLAKLLVRSSQKKRELYENFVAYAEVV